METLLLTALISIVTSLVTLIVTVSTNNWIQKRFLIFKLRKEHEYEQRKAIKNVLSKYKVPFINSAEFLNHRLWNLSKNHSRKWHNVNGKYDHDGYYYRSFIYRILRHFAWIKIIESKLIFLDTTIATKDDLNFVKYLNFFPQLFQDTDLFDGFNYDSNYSTDHIFRDTFEELYSCLIKDEIVMSYTEFKVLFTNDHLKFAPICKFVDNINPEEDRLRWDLIHCFHLTLISFLNSYGYDYQQTSIQKIGSLLSKHRKCKIYSNYNILIERNKLKEEKSIKLLMKELSKFCNTSLNINVRDIIKNIY
jgi:hypothetical protein